MTLPIIPVAMLGKRGTRSFPTLRSTSNHTVGIGTSQNVNLPSGIQAGDLVVLGISARTTVLGLSAINVPSGWTSLAYDTSEVTSFCRLIYIIATGSMSTVTIETPGARFGRRTPKIQARGRSPGQIQACKYGGL